MAKVIIGALVGMGPNSTAPFYDAVMNYARKLYGAKNDMDFPEMVMISLPTPFVPGVELDHSQMISILTDAVEKNYCTVGIIACTDISPLVSFYTENILFTDSMDSLAQATIEQYMRFEKLY